MKKYKSADELPASLNIDDVAAYLNISRAYAYQLANKEGFPTLRIGTRLIVPKDAFEIWIKENTGK